MKRNNDIWKVVCAVCLVCILAACKSSKETTTSGLAIMKTEEAFFSSMLDHTLHFQTFSARIKLDYLGIDKELSARMQLKMIRNDRLQLSIQPFLGIEMFRVEISTDSIKMIDRINKRYIADRYDNLKDELNVDFNYHTLQALFTNQLFVPGEDRISTLHFRRFRMTQNDAQATLKLKDRNGLNYVFTADGEEKLLSTVIENKRENQLLTWDYQQFQNTNAQRFPMKMTARITVGEKTRGTATLTFSSLEINQPLKTDFNIPSGYKKVTLEQLIKSLEQK